MSSDFLGRLSSPTSPATMEAQKQTIMNTVKSELQVAAAQELLNKINEKCFIRCVSKPGTALSNSEQGCLSRCMERYMEAFNIVSRVYLDRLGRERSEGGFS